MIHNAPNMMKRLKRQKPPALKPCPSVDRIFVVQFQFFDNGPNPGGRESSSHTMTLEVYLEAKNNLSKPHWKRSVALIEPSDFLNWADRALGKRRLTPEQHSIYAPRKRKGARLKRHARRFCMIGRANAQIDPHSTSARELAESLSLAHAAYRTIEP